LSDDDDDGRDGEEDQTTFPLFAADDVRTTFASDVHRSHGDNVINVSDNYSDENFTEDESDSTASSESELVGPGHPTPPRFGHQSMRPISVGPSDQECKRAWSEVLQTEQELEEEEAQATLVSRNRERRRQELMAAKRRFVVFDRQPRRCLAKCLTLSWYLVLVVSSEYPQVHVSDRQQLRSFDFVKITTSIASGHGDDTIGN
jgi:hypothetical protein